jgi:hypothetical protein
MITEPRVLTPARGGTELGAALLRTRGVDNLPHLGAGGQERDDRCQAFHPVATVRDMLGAAGPAPSTNATEPARSPPPRLIFGLVAVAAGPVAVGIEPVLVRPDDTDLVPDLRAVEVGAIRNAGHVAGVAVRRGRSGLFWAGRSVGLLLLSAGFGFAVWVPRTRSPHATCTYSWMRPPSRSRRIGRMAVLECGGVPLAGGR